MVVHELCPSVEQGFLIAEASMSPFISSVRQRERLTVLLRLLEDQSRY